MSKTSEVIANIGGILEESGLLWSISYIPSTKSYNIFISDEDSVEHTCSTCIYGLEKGSPKCTDCHAQDNWESMDV